MVSPILSAVVFLSLRLCVSAFFVFLFLPFCGFLFAVLASWRLGGSFLMRMAITEGRLAQLGLEAEPSPTDITITCNQPGKNLNLIAGAAS